MSTPAIDRRKQPTVNDVYVHESGTPGSPAVVFIHGGGPSAPMWRDHMNELAGEFHCLAPDLPGFGRSNRLKPISLEQTADLVAELIAARVPAGRAHVVGLSYGGSVGLALLGRHPDILDHVVIDGACVIRQRIDPLILAAVTVVSPVVNTRAAEAFLRLIGLRRPGSGIAHGVAGCLRRSWMEGYTGPDLEGRAGGGLPDPARRRRTGTCPGVECRPSGAHAERDGSLRAGARPRLVHLAARAAHPHGRGMAQR